MSSLHSLCHLIGPTYCVLCRWWHSGINWTHSCVFTGSHSVSTLFRGLWVAQQRRKKQLQHYVFYATIHSIYFAAWTGSVHEACFYLLESVMWVSAFITRKYAKVFNIEGNRNRLNVLVHIQLQYKMAKHWNNVFIFTAELPLLLTWLLAPQS